MVPVFWMWEPVPFWPLDPGSGAFLTPWIRDPVFFLPLDPGIPDLGSQTHFSEGLVTFFWVKSTIILCQLAQKIFDKKFLCEIYGYKKGNTKIFSPSFGVVSYGMEKKQNLTVLYTVPYQN